MGKVRTQEKGKKINSKDEGGTSIYIYISDKLQFCLINSYNICIKLISNDQTSDHLYKHLVSREKKNLNLDLSYSKPMLFPIIMFLWQASPLTLVSLPSPKCYRETV